MRIIIFANGILDDPAAEVGCWLRPGDLVIAADGGTQHALAAGITPAHVIGDLDSLSPELHGMLNAAGTVIHAHPPAKDETDLELALLWAVQQSDVTQIIVLGALGGRPDQELANLLLLALSQVAGRDVIIAGGPWTIRCLRSGETLSITGQSGETVSLIPLGGDAVGITTRGLAYPLNDETLHFGPARGVSNVLEGQTATVALREGLLWVFHQNSKLDS